MRFQLPSRVCSDFEGYNYLASLNKLSSVLVFDTIVIDFKENTWFEANLCAILGALFSKAQDNFNNIKFENLPDKQRDILSRNHFLASFGGEKIEDFNNTTIKYRKNRLTDEKLIHHFLYNDLLGKQEFPKLSPLAHKEIERSIFEIFSNAILHGNCEFVYSCGQYFPRKAPPRIDFTIVDMGKSIKKNVCDFFGKEISGIDSIKWALKENSTTKPIEKNIPGGLGLKLICDFVKLNNGKIQIVSDTGCWQLNGNKEDSFVLNYPFPGTLVNLEFNLGDQSLYCLKEEEPESIIF